MTVPLYNLTDTWNSGATVFTAILMNVTDTGHAAGSALLDLQVGGTSKASIKDRDLGWTMLTDVLCPTGLSNPGVWAGIYNNSVFGTQDITIRTYAQNIVTFNGQLGSFRIHKDVGVGFTSSSDSSGTLDTPLYRDTAGTLAQRNSTNAQTLRVYNTFTDSSNYERAELGWASNVFNIGVDNLGSGSTRMLRLNFYHNSSGNGGTIEGDISNSGIAFKNYIGGPCGLWYESADSIRVASNTVLKWSGTSDNAIAGVDTGVSRSAAGVLAIGNGTAGNATGTVNVASTINLTVDKGSVGTGTVTFDSSAATKQKLTVTGSLTIAYSNWPASGTYGEVEVQLVNGGSATITWPTVSWLKGDGTNSTTFSTMGVTLYSSGTNTVTVWSIDGGSTLYGRAA